MHAVPCSIKYLRLIAATMSEQNGVRTMIKKEFQLHSSPLLITSALLVIRYNTVCHTLRTSKDGRLVSLLAVLSWRLHVRPSRHR